MASVMKVIYKKADSILIHESETDDAVILSMTSPVTNRQSHDKPTNEILDITNILPELVMLLVSHVHSKLQTLILKLRPGDHNQMTLQTMTDTELDIYMKNLLSELSYIITSSLEEIWAMIKEARPQPNDLNYDDSIVIYTMLVDLMDQLIKQMQESVTRVVEAHRAHLEHLQNEIENPDVLKYLLDSFQRSLEKEENGYDGWSPRFETINKYLTDLRK